MDQPLDNVFIKFNINREAAERLKKLAETGGDSLRNLGILSFQIEKNSIVDLRLDPKYSNKSETKTNLSKKDDLDNLYDKPYLNSNNLQLNSFLDKNINNISQDYFTTPSTSNENSKNTLNRLLNQNLSISLEVKQDSFKSPILVKQKNKDNLTTVINNTNTNKPNSSISKTSSGSNTNVSIDSFNQNNNAKTRQQNNNSFPTMQPNSSIQTNQLNLVSSVDNSNFKTIQNFNKSSSSLPISTSTIQQIQLNYTTVSTPNSNFKNVISIKTPLIRNPNIKLSPNLNQNQIRSSDLNSISFNNKEISNNSANSNNLENNICNSNNFVYNSSASNVALTSPLLVNLLKSDVNENFNSSTTNLSTSNSSSNTIKEPPSKRIKTKKNRKPKDKPPDAISNTTVKGQINQTFCHKNASSTFEMNNNLNNTVSSPSNNVQLFENKNLVSSTIVNSSIITIPTQVTLSYSSTNIKLEKPSYENSKILNNPPNTYHTSPTQISNFNNQSENQIYSTNNNPNITNVSSEITLNNHNQLIYSQQDKNDFSANSDTELFNILKTIPETNSIPNSVSINENQYSSHKLSSLKDSSYGINDSKAFLPQKNNTKFLNLPSPVEENKTNHLINPFTGHMEPMMSEDEEEMSIDNIQTVKNYKNRNLEGKNILNKESNQSSDTDSGICKSTNDASSQSSSEISPINDLINNQDFLTKLNDKNLKNNKIDKSPTLLQTNLTNQKLEIIPNLLVDDPQPLDSLTNFTNSSIVEDNAISKNKFVNEMLSMPKDISFFNSKENCDLFFRVKSGRDIDVLNQSDFYLNNSDFNYKNSNKNISSIDNNQIEEFFNKTDTNTLGLNETTNFDQEYNTDLEDVNALVLDTNNCRNNFESHVEFIVSSNSLTSENKNNYKEKKVCEENKNIGKENNIHISQNSSITLQNENQPQYTIVNFNDSINVSNFDILSNNLQFQENLTNNNDLLFKINSDNSCESNKNITLVSNEIEGGDEEGVRNHSVAAGDHNYTSLKRPCVFVNSENTINTNNSICSNKVKKVDS